MKPERIFIGPGARNHDTAQQVLWVYPDAERIEIDDPDNPPLPEDPKKRFVYAKRSLLLKEYYGPLLRQLSRPYGEGIPEYYLYTGTGCPYDCEYCFLQTWLSNPVPTIHVNQETLIDQIEDVVNAFYGRVYLHCGEVTDALAFNQATVLTDTLSKMCAVHTGLICELRTKSAEVDFLLSDNMHHQNMVISWTLAPESVTSAYEPRTASLSERFEAMKKVAQTGYPVALRLDPMVLEEGFEDAYRQLLEKVDEVLPIPPATLSMGSMRLGADCLSLARQRFPRSRLFAGELVQCEDGRYRYALPLRKRAYEVVNETAMRLWNMQATLCMEP